MDSVNVHQRAKALKSKNYGEDDGAAQSKRHQMRIASSGRNQSDKESPSRSDRNEMASVDDRSFDPD